ncbi:MAG: hypothetical protein PHT33_14195 [bacterium]|nr:hypothetical protein [bacterium]
MIKTTDDDEENYKPRVLDDYIGARYEVLLELNPNGNQGIRYSLIGLSLRRII